MANPKSLIEITNEIPLYSPSEGMRFYEYNVKVCVPDAEKLFRERLNICKFVGTPYSWKDFYLEIVLLHARQDPHASTLDWWSSTYRSAAEKYADMTMVRRRIPPSIRSALNRRLQEAALMKKKMRLSKPATYRPETEMSRTGGPSVSSLRTNDDHFVYSSGQTPEPLDTTVNDPSDDISSLQDHPFRFNFDLPAF